MSHMLFLATFLGGFITKFPHNLEIHLPTQLLSQHPSTPVIRLYICTLIYRNFKREDRFQILKQFIYFHSSNYFRGFGNEPLQHHCTVPLSIPPMKSELPYEVTRDHHFSTASKLETHIAIIILNIKFLPMKYDFKSSKPQGVLVK